MADIVDKATRSRMMSGIRGKNTKPEMIVRSGLHRRGFRFRLHQKSLPGSPDLVLRQYSAIIFVQGCFWHGHECALFKWPKSHEALWRTKIEANRARDIRAIRDLTASGWRVAEVWECALKGPKRLGENVVLDRLEEWLVTPPLQNERFGIRGVTSLCPGTGMGD